MFCSLIRFHLFSSLMCIKPDHIYQSCLIIWSSHSLSKSKKVTVGISMLHVCQWLMEISCDKAAQGNCGLSRFFVIDFNYIGPVWQSVFCVKGVNKVLSSWKWVDSFLFFSLLFFHFLSMHSVNVCKTSTVFKKFSETLRSQRWLVNIFNASSFSSTVDTSKSILQWGENLI